MATISANTGYLKMSKRIKKKTIKKLKKKINQIKQNKNN